MAAICSWHLVSLPEPESARERRENNPKPQPAPEAAPAGGMGAGSGEMPQQPPPGRAGTRSDTFKLLEPSGVPKEPGEPHSQGRVPLSFVGRHREGGEEALGSPYGLPHFWHPRVPQRQQFPAETPVPSDAPGPCGGRVRWQRHVKGHSGGHPRGRGSDGTPGAGKIHPHPPGKASEGARLGRAGN